MLATMTGAYPMPLAAREISDWLEAHPSPVPRHWVDEVMFSLDHIVLSAMAEE